MKQLQKHVFNKKLRDNNRKKKQNDEKQRSKNRIK